MLLLINFTKYKIPLLLIVLASTSFANDLGKKLFSPSTNIAWDANQINFVKAGNIANGEKLNKDKMCSLCHGEKGLSNGRNWPNLAGQTANYTFKQLMDYKDQKRLDSSPAALMTSLLKNISLQEMADLAQYYAQFSLPKEEKEYTLNSEQNKSVINLIRNGDGSRMLVPCLACHGSKAQGAIADTPALAGQKAIYFKNTMNDFKSGSRHNDVYSRMRLIAKSLTRDEINAMADYFADMNQQNDDVVRTQN